jgi:putative DNA primase/helicase
MADEPPPGFEEFEKFKKQREKAKRARSNGGAPHQNDADEIDEAPEARPPAFSDEALALGFAARHLDNLRFVAAWGRWMKWDRCRWKSDDTLHTFSLARATCREASIECNDKESVRKAIASAKTVAAVEKLARSDPRLAATTDQWDGDLWALNTPDGTIDLHTGDVSPHRREQYCTKATAVAPGGICPRWIAFLERITNGDSQLQGFLQRVAGYCLTGVTVEHAMFFAHGLGGNGKGVFSRTLSGIMGDYAVVASMETFTETNSDRHPTELARLRGARLVSAQETERGRRWAETRIKELTGGDPITARFMHQNFFEYSPQFKLWIAGNHRPGLRGVNEAIRRRMNLIPFVVTIPEHEKDLGLDDKLRKEWPGILQWAIAGCLEWQHKGLMQPEAVRAATDAYLEGEDSLALWLAECCCSARPGDYAHSSALFGNWCDWAEKAGERPGSQKKFSQDLEEHGFAKGRDTRGRMIFYGIAIKVQRDE